MIGRTKISSMIMDEYGMAPNDFTIIKMIQRPLPANAKNNTILSYFILESNSQQLIQYFKEKTKLKSELFPQSQAIKVSINHSKTKKNTNAFNSHLPK